MNSDTHADSGQGGKSDGGVGPLRGKYYPVKGGSSSNMAGKANDAWRPTPSGPAVGRGLGDVSPRTRRNFVHGAGSQAQAGWGGSVGKAYYMSGTDNTNPKDGADGPDGSGGGTTHAKSNWFAKNKGNTGSGSGCMKDPQTTNSNAGGLSKTTPYGSGDFGKSKTNKA